MFTTELEKNEHFTLDFAVSFYESIGGILGIGRQCFGTIEQLMLLL